MGHVATILVGSSALAHAHLEQQIFTKLKELRSPSAIETEVSSPGIPNSCIVYDSL
jgi:hypothetical protein